jgi:hypothetical protein
MEFRTIGFKDETGQGWVTGIDKLTPKEKVELIKQLCPGIDSIAEFYRFSTTSLTDGKDIEDIDISFDYSNKITDYLLEQLKGQK